MTKYTDLRELFAQNNDSEKAESMAAYMKNRFLFYGLPTPKRRAVYRGFLKEEEKKKVIDWDLLDRCYEDEHREFQYFVVDYLRAMQNFLTFDDVPRIKKYVKTKQWWDTIDGLSGIIGDIAFVDERISELMLEWSLDEDF